MCINVIFKIEPVTNYNMVNINNKGMVAKEIVGSYGDILVAMATNM